MVVAAALAVVFSGFTVDDALITARVAAHLAGGDGYRFNRWGPPVDAVTPLGWANVLAAFGPGTPLEMLGRARWLGLVAWLAAAAILGALTPRDRGRWVVLSSLALSTPLAIWATAGMETGVVVLGATLALVEGPLAAVAAGLAAAWRPELLPWAVALATGASLMAGDGPTPRLRALAVRLPAAVGPALAAALVRNAAFGAFAPLSSIAKAPELSHGLFYATDALLGTGIPLLLIAPRALAKGDGRTRTLVAAVLAHWLSMVVAGGDWMALYRLAVPVLPTAMLGAALLATQTSVLGLALRALLCSIRPLWLAATVAWPARHVLAHRAELIERARPVLAGARSIACVDVGWVGAASTARILDLGGVTDPVVARLPGGHTSKRISNGLFENRAVDTVVLLLAPDAKPSARWQDSEVARLVEARVAALPALEHFEVRALLPLGGTRQSYLVLVASERGSLSPHP